jgi:hypothetical protein
VIESYTVYKITCVCKEKDAVSLNGLEEFWDLGWHQEMIFGQDYDLCPDCSKEIKNFLDVEGDDSNANDT